MGRPLRIDLPNFPFHILNRGNNRQIVFREEEDFDYYLWLLKRYKKDFDFRLYHFCLMPNHIHFQLEMTRPNTLSRFMQSITLAQTWFFNKKYGTVGHVWQGRFKSSLIDKDEYFLHCGFYIEGNPVRQGLVKKAEDWKWSSYKFYAFNEENPLLKTIIDVDPFYLRLAENFDKRREIYQKSFENLMNDYFLKDVRTKLDKGVFGRPEFVKDMEERFKISYLRMRGRPRKIEK